MPWEQVQIDAEGNAIPNVNRIEVKVEDVHRTDLPGCLKHRTAGAIQQFTSWKDLDGTEHHRWTGYLICAECSTFLDNIDPLRY